MSDTTIDIAHGIGDDGAPVLLVGEEGEARTATELLAQLPALREPAHATALAEAVNHLAHGTEYRVIADPAAFAAAYRARLSREDPDAPFRDGVVRLIDHGAPDFAAIAPPRLDGGTLRFFAEDTILGLPYCATAAPPDFRPGYEPVPLTPIPGGPAEANDRKVPQPGFTGDTGEADSSSVLETDKDQEPD